ncbi:MAG: mobile mystery protein A [Sulfuricaulis sp.]
MAQILKTVAREQLSHTFEAIQAVRQIQSPRKGWLRAIRYALGMTAKQFAERLAVVPSRIVKIEESEVSGSLSLKNLRRAADALNCELVYAIVPRTSLEEMVRKQATAIATERYRRIAHTMALEKQSVPESVTQKEINASVEDLIRRSPKQLWDKKW